MIEVQRVNVSRHEIESFAREQLNKYGLHSWKFAFNNRKRSYGVCNYSKKTIYLSLFLLNNLWRDTILHEIAHALTPNSKNHGITWQRVARDIGANPQRVSKVITLDQKDYKYITLCQSCNKVVSRDFRKKQQKFFIGYRSRCCRSKMYQINS